MHIRHTPHTVCHVALEIPKVRLKPAYTHTQNLTTQLDTPGWMFWLGLLLPSFVPRWQCIVLEEFTTSTSSKTLSLSLHLKTPLLSTQKAYGVCNGGIPSNLVLNESTQ